MRSKILFFSVVVLVVFFVLTPTFGQCGISDRLFGRCYADGGGYVSGYAGGYRQGGPGTVRQPYQLNRSYSITTQWPAAIVSGFATYADMRLGSKQIGSDERVRMAELENERLTLEYQYGQPAVFHGQPTGYGGGDGNRGRVDPVPTSGVANVPLELGWVNRSCFYLKVYDGDNFVTILRPGERKKIGGPHELPQTDQGFVGYFLVPQGGHLVEQVVLPDDNTFNAWVFIGEPCNNR